MATIIVMGMVTLMLLGIVQTEKAHKFFMFLGCGFEKLSLEIDLQCVGVRAVSFTGEVTGHSGLNQMI